MPRFPPEKPRVLIPEEDISTWIETSDLLSREVGEHLDYAQTYWAFAATVMAGELGEDGEWEGDPTDPELSDTVAAYLQSGHLDRLGVVSIEDAASCVASQGAVDDHDTDNDEVDDGFLRDVTDADRDD